MPPFSPSRTAANEFIDFRRLGAGAAGAPGSQFMPALMMVVFVA